jgi:CheY-like chemotaxis protein
VTAPRALVVDDSAVVRFAVAKRLRALGLEVDEQATAAPPSAEVASGLACALLDLELDEGGDGVQVAVALRAARPDLPIAFFSATTSDEHATRASAFGPVFSKPGDIDAAIAWVRRAIRSE